MEEIRIDAVGPDREKTKLEFFEHSDKPLAIDQLDWWYTVAECLSLGLERERTCRENDALIGATHHGAPEVPDLARGHRARVFLALEEDLETHERVHLQNSDAINSAVVRLPGYGYMLKTRFAQ